MRNELDYCKLTTSGGYVSPRAKVLVAIPAHNTLVGSNISAPDITEVEDDNWG